MINFVCPSFFFFFKRLYISSLYWIKEYVNMQQGQRFEEDKFIYETNRSSCRALKRITIFFHDTFNLLINNYDQFLYFYLPAPSYTPKILNFIRYFQKIPIWSPISSNGINAIQRVSRVFIKEKRKNLKRSNNNKLIKKRNQCIFFFFFFFFEIYTQKNPQTIFIFTTRSIASKPNVSE